MPEFDGVLTGQGWVFMEIPFSVEAEFGSKARVPVRGTMNGFPFRNSVFPKGDGTHQMMVCKEIQLGAGARAGDTVRVVMEIDTDPRVVEAPEDLAAALAENEDAAAAWDRLAPSHKKEYVRWIEEAKKPETRANRIAKMIERVGAGQKLK
ncbi:MAG: YdeI/OmpD-associated family protein [Armatimonadota bacterium]